MRWRPHERRDVTIDDLRAADLHLRHHRAAEGGARVSHRRVMSWAGWFAGLIDATPDDRMYDCLPIYHSVGGVVATGSMLVAGGSVVIAREIFGAAGSGTISSRWDCTLFQYIGELCRYLLQAPPHPSASARIGCGCAAATACAARSGRRSRRASGSRGSSNSTPPPKAISRSTMSRASPARSAASRRSWRIASRRAIVQFDVETGTPLRDARRPLHPLRARRGGRSDRPDRRRRRARRPVRGLHRAGARREKKDPARRVRAGRRLVPHRRPDALRRQGLLPFRRPDRRHLPLEGRERRDHAKSPRPSRPAPA